MKYLLIAGLLLTTLEAIRVPDLPLFDKVAIEEKMVLDMKKLGQTIQRYIQIEKKSPEQASCSMGICKVENNDNYAFSVSSTKSRIKIDSISYEENPKTTDVKFILIQQYNGSEAMIGADTESGVITKVMFPLSI